MKEMTIITIEMKNSTHALKLAKALKVFFKKADAGGDSYLAHWNGYSKKRINCGKIGHDVNMSKINMFNTKKIRTKLY